MSAAQSANQRVIGNEVEMEIYDFYQTGSRPEKAAPVRPEWKSLAMTNDTSKTDASSPAFDVDEAIAELCGPPVIKPAHMPSRSFRTQPTSKHRKPDPHKADARLPPHEKGQDFLYLNSHQREQVAFFKV